MHWNKADSVSRGLGGPIELPGVVKFEFPDFERTRKDAESVGLSESEYESDPSEQYLFQALAKQDSNLALTELRSEIEQRLIRLAEVGGVKLKLRGLGYLLKTLEKHGLLTLEQQSVLAEISGMLNAHIHGPVYNHFAVSWVLETGPKLLRGARHTS